VLRYYELPLMYKSRLATVWRINTLKNPASSDLPIPANVVWGYCGGYLWRWISLARSPHWLV